MGDMAMMALERAGTEESLADDYIAGNMGMEEAYEHGFLDATGAETQGMQSQWDRTPIGTLESLNQQIKECSMAFDDRGAGHIFGQYVDINRDEGIGSKSYHSTRVSNHSTRVSKPQSINKLHYHEKISFKYLRESDKAYFVRYKGSDIWIPKKIVRHFNYNGTCYVHKITFNKVVSHG